MREKDADLINEIKKVKIKLTAWFFLLFFLICGLFVITGLPLEQIALAITGNYTKSSGQQLTTIDWNKLPDDFVAKSGDTMSGNLNMGTYGITNLRNPSLDSDAVNRGSMNSAISTALSAGGQIKDVSGSSLKMVCGATVPGATAWQNYPGGAIVYIDISAAGFTAGSIPYIFTSLGGLGYQGYTRGATSIYTQDFSSPLTTLSSGFRVFVFNDSGQFEPWIDYQWYINWCALGN